MELGLRIFNYGIDYRQWVPITKKEYVLNPEIARKYFSVVHSVPYSIQDVFDQKKQKNAFRVFVLGGSSAAGYPYMPLGSFSRYLKQRLQLVYPNNKIEVINIAMTAVNTYTIRDLLPGVLEEKPDLILIYAGHNEYYGALGVGSMESLGRSRTIVNLLLYLKQFRTFQLISNIIKSSIAFFSKNNGYKSGTLMSRMVKDKEIPLDSKIYEEGVNQFKGNLNDILNMIKSAKVPVIIGTLTCNLKDQKPFVSVENGKFPPAITVYKKAEKDYKGKNYGTSLKLFKKAKDLDALRFRAPSEFNWIILKLSKKFNIPVIKIDSLFAADSPHGIIGNNLITDHLHPTLHGYELIGRLFYREMEKLKYLPHGTKINYPDSLQNKLTIKNFLFTPLDSVIALYRIRILKNDWPYINKKNKKSLTQLIKPHNLIDSTAFDFLMNEFTWEKSHRIIAQWYLKHNNLNEFQKYMNVLISQYPVIVDYYVDAAAVLLKNHWYDDAYKYLLKKYEITPDAFSAKWLGIINLSHNKLNNAIKYLKISIKMKPDDPQVLYNLAGAYALKKDFTKALSLINEALRIAPDYNDAVKFKKELEIKTNHY